MNAFRETDGITTKDLVRGTGLGGGIGSILYTKSGGSIDDVFLYNGVGSTELTTRLATRLL